MPKNKTFKEKVRAVVAGIRPGTVLTYAEVAKKAGSPRAYRAVASLMAKNFDPRVPCHRVIRSDGKLGGYNRGGMKKKQQLLTEEGYTIARSN